MMARMSIAALLVMPTLMHAREAPPAGGPPRPFTMPAKERFNLPNGLQATLVPFGQLPKVTVCVLVRTGNLDEGEQTWLADITGELMRDAGRLGRGAKAGFQAFAEPFEPLVRRIVAQQAERGDAGGGCERIAAERAGLKHLAGRQHMVHHIGPPAVRPHRQPAANDLAERREVRPQTQ